MKHSGDRPDAEDFCACPRNLFVDASFSRGWSHVESKFRQIVSRGTPVPFSNRPLYLQVRDALAARIASGELLPGSAIPSEGELARQIGVSAGTVRKALQLMEADRLILRRQGRGTFVRDPCSHELAQRFIRLYRPDGTPICGQIKSTEITRGAANAMERDRLRLGAADEVYRIRRVRHCDGTPFSVEDATLPADLFPGLGESGPVADPIAALAQEYRILLGSAQERVSSAVPPEAAAKALRTASGVPVVVLDRVVFRIDDRRPVEWRVAHSHVPGGYYLAEIR
jgi:GntR family transcriptional regulator